MDIFNFLQNSNLLQTIGEVASYGGVALGALLVNKFKNKISDWKFNKKHNGQFVIEVYSKIVQLRTLLESNRAVVYLRHNGIKLHNGKGLDKISMIYESCDEATRSIKEESQNVLLHMYEAKIIDCDTNGFIIVFTEELGDGFLKRNLASQGINTLVMVPFRKNKGEIPEGYVAVSYNEVVDFTEDMLSQAISAAGDIGYLLRK